MDREADRLIRLVNELLVLTRADAGALRLNIQPLDLAELARTRCKRLTPLAGRRDIALRVIGGDAGLPVAGDADRLAQVLDNLLDNAIRFAPDRSTITLKLECAGELAQCTVHDEGPGIPAEHLPFIFERFYRVDAARSRASAGAGLGLAIARSLIVAQGGSISAQSAEGQGTTITFSLPLARTARQLPDS
jgi:signal transduction histidine kinase